MKTTEKLKSVTIAQAAKKFGWTVVPVRGMVHLGESIRIDLPVREPRPEWNRNSVPDGDIEKAYAEHRLAIERHERKVREEDLAFAQKITLRDVLMGLESAFVKYESRHSRLRAHYRGDIDRLTKIGFSRFDCVALTGRTVPISALKKVPRSELLKRDAACLNTLSPKLLRSMTRDWVNDKPINLPRLTVADVLAGKPYLLCCTQTLMVLEQLGFGPKDGRFMRKENDPRERLIQSLVAKEGLDRAEAAKFTIIAAKRKWI